MGLRRFLMDGHQKAKAVLARAPVQLAGARRLWKELKPELQIHEQIEGPACTVQYLSRTAREIPGSPSGSSSTGSKLSSRGGAPRD